MSDTPPEITQRVRRMLMARSNEERFMMGVRSFEAARQVVIASLPENLSPEEFKRQLYQRVYGEPAPF